MDMIYGANSAMPANLKLTNGYTMYDWVARQKSFPAFWGRTLLGEDAITEEEISFLREKDCKIMLVVRDLSEVKVSSVDGTADAQRAIEAAKALGVPENEGIAIFAEIGTDWSINHNWMMGFASVLAENGYVPGFIGNTDSSLNFNFDRQCGHFVQATEAESQYGAVYCATEPKVYAPEEWAPYCPSDLKPEDMHLWASGATVYGEYKVADVYARDEEVVAKMW